MSKSALSQLSRRKQVNATRKSLTLQQARARTVQFAHDPLGWRELARHLGHADDLPQARQAAEKAIELAPDDAESWVVLGKIESRAHRDDLADKHFRQALALDAGHAEAHQNLAEMAFRKNDNIGALQHAEGVLGRRPNDVTALSRKAQVLSRLFRYEEAAAICEQLIRQDPKNLYVHWNDLGNVKRDLGLLEEAEACYRKAASLTADDPVPFSNWLTLSHYIPHKDPAEILALCKKWGEFFAPDKTVERAIPADRSPGRTLRIGIFSDGFRQHPVGAMTTPALEQLVKLGIEIYAYTTSNVVDSVTRRLMAIAAKWTPIATVREEQLAQQIRDDQIDILIDLSGHNAGNRIRTMALEPAPVLVKWVGGLINTTGVESIDYLLTDGIESPLGSDANYTEKLIRMPDDYICYMPPTRVPDVGALPALKNGYVTFGCFNNPTKVNPVVLEQWAGLLHAVPGSKLFLKGGPFGNIELCNRTLDILKSHGITPERVRLEGHSGHFELFQRYNEVDVALDPWPYSGGLTTCEAMLMGVPVVTLPGPTFAGRHSATHLVNVGMPELVVDNWDEYRARVLELVSDLNSLSTIRGHLRRILLDSPVCDASKFARHLADALRAIWQRYCEGKPPAALAFTPEGLPWFEGEAAPMALVHPAPDQEATNAGSAFNFAFQGRIVMLDHGNSLVATDRFIELSRLGAMLAIAFDPASNLRNAGQLQRDGHIQHYQPYATLGDGQPAVLHACLDASMTGTLEPLDAACQLPFAREAATVIARLPIATTRLDDVDGLEKVEWMVMDATNDNLAIIRGGERLLSSALTIQVGIRFTETFHHQAGLSDLSSLLARLGFRLLRLHNPEHASYFPLESVKEHRGSQLISAQAVFIPDERRMKLLDDNQLLKLAFIMHAGYGAADIAHRILQGVKQDTGIAARYLSASGWLADAIPKPGQTASARKFIHICYNNIHVQPFISMLADPRLAEDYDHKVYIEKRRSIPGYDNDLSCNSKAFFFDAGTDLGRILQEALQDDVAAIVFHGLFFPWQKQLVRDIGNRKKTIWVIWGGDLYNPLRQHEPMTEVVEQLDAVCTLSDGDYKIFCENYPQKPRLAFAYAGGYPLQRIALPEQKSRQIFVGNSGDMGNCHIEILDALSRKKDIGRYKIVMPISYNLTPGYEQQLVRHVAKLGLERNVSYLKTIIPTAEYYALLAQSEFCITAHHRQQALGNIIAALYFGVKTVLRRQITLNGLTIENPSWAKVTQEFSAEPVSFEDFSQHEELGQIAFPDPSQLDSQRRKILALYDSDAILQTMKDRFGAIAKL